MRQLVGGSSSVATRRRRQLLDFRAHCSTRTDQDLTSPQSLHRWSVEHHRDFWLALLEWSALVWEGEADVVCTSDDVEAAVFFPHVRLNYTENLLRTLASVGDESPAVTSVHGDGSVEQLSRGALRSRVQSVATALSAAGVRVGDRVVVVAPNNARAVTAVLAVAAIGATVSTAMPDMGPTALLGRFEQVEPVAVVLDRADHREWAGDPGDTLDTMLAGLPTVRRLLVLDDQALPDGGGVRVSRLDTSTADPGEQPYRWPRLPFNHPLFVMFSSGTSGPPKAIVHGAGGTLLEHVKEHQLHNDIGAGDSYFHHSTTAWMVWNRQLSALAVGANIVLYDGVVRGPETLWELVASQGVTVFGTSPAYLQLCQDVGYRPAAGADLSRLRSVLSSGAVLQDWQFDWFGEAVGPLPLQTISGGTDIIGAFVLGHPELPVTRGRSQSLGLGMDVAAVDASGTELVETVGELVCRNPFPSRPIAFLRDPEGTRLHETYFADHPGMWTHGDLIDIAADGSSCLHGRSDGVLNIDGVRIGPTEIYSVLRAFPELVESMAVEQRDPEVAGTARLVLLVVLRGMAGLDDDLAQRIRGTLRHQASAAHVPSLVLAVDALPQTHNGKPSERAARDVVNGNPVANADALQNPESLEGIRRALDAAAARTAGAAPLSGADEIAVVVAQLWRDTLGPDADGDRSFSDLGGTSRQAMTLVRQVRLLLGRDVQLEAFLTAPTLFGLTAAVRAAERAADAPPVVRLAAGDAELPPLFFLHDAWGDLDVYWPAAQLLTDTGPVYGVRANLAGSDGTRRTIAELAAIHAVEIQRTAPAGPLRLAGHSFGGLLAFETARVLAGAGREVDFLGLLDSMPARGNMPPLERMVMRYANRAAQLLPGLRSQGLREIARGRVGPGATADDAETFRVSRQVYHAHEWHRWDRPVTYFRASRRVPVAQNMIRAWRRVAPDLTIVDVPGRHDDILGQRNVVVTAARISTALARAGRRSSTRS